MEDSAQSALEAVENGCMPSVGALAALVEAGSATRGGAIRERLAAAATAERRAAYGERVFIRALVEISSVCKNDCLYCGLRASNASAQRYRLKPDEIAACAEEGYALGFRTVVLQGGEDPFFTDAIVEGVIRDIKSAHPDMAVTLSLGERGRDSFARLREAGADRYLLRHETADAVHYSRLHPPSMSFANRMKCLADLKELGYQTGCGFMVGSPRQTPGTIAEDIAFIASFRPEMCGIGPFIPHHATPFAKEKAGTVEATCLLLSIVRLLHPHVLLPSTTALGTIDPEGREKGIRAGANVVMPNISPAAARGKYEIYDNKLCSGAESAQMLDELRRRVAAAGCSIAVDRGDFRP